MEYRVEVRVRGLVPKFDVNSGETHMVKGDIEKVVVVDVPDHVSRDLHGREAARMATEQVRQGLGQMAERSWVSCHNITSVCANDGNWGNDDHDSGRMPMKGRRGDYGRTAPRVNGRFA